MSSDDSITHNFPDATKVSEDSDSEAKIDFDFTQYIDPSDFNLDPSPSKRPIRIDEADEILSPESFGTPLQQDTIQSPSSIVAPDDFNVASPRLSDMEMLPIEHLYARQLVLRNELQELHSAMPDERKFCAKTLEVQNARTKTKHYDGKQIYNSWSAKIQRGYVELLKPMSTTTGRMKDLLLEMQGFRRKVDAHKRKLSCLSDDTETHDEIDYENEFNKLATLPTATPTPTPPITAFNRKTQTQYKCLDAGDWSVESDITDSPDEECRPPTTDDTSDNISTSTASELTSISSDEFGLFQETKEFYEDNVPMSPGSDDQ